MTEHQPTASIDAVEQGLASAGYIANRQIATAVYLAERIEKPILVEGPAGVGKTELAKAIAAWRGLKLIRLQCYEGLDEAKALYEWKYAKQLLYTQILKDKLGEVLGDADTLPAALNKLHDFGDVFFSKEFVEPRPLLQALEQPRGCVLLIDEIDKSDAEFESLLLENPVRFPGHAARTRHHLGNRAADGDPDLQQRTRFGRCAEAALSASAHRLPRTEARGTYRGKPRPRYFAIFAAADREFHQRRSHPRPEKTAVGV